MKYLKLSLVCLLLIGLSGAVVQDPRTDRANEIREDATITYTGHYDVACPPALVKKALQNPALLGVLWRSYRFTPTYKVSALNEPGAVHVKDPTGLVGDVWPVGSPGHAFTYLAEGTVDHWAVPALNEGGAVFDVDLAATGAGTAVTVTVSMQPESYLARAALWAASPLVIKRIKSRVSNNFKDIGWLLEAIAANPDEVAQRLRGKTRRDFDRIFGQ